MGDEVMAAALIDRLLHHCHIVNIRGSSYRMREHTDLSKILHSPPVEPPHRISWSWSHDAGLEFDPDQSTLVEWTLTEREQGGTLLELRESGFRTEAAYEENQDGWTAELGELVDLLEGPRASSNLK